MDKLSSQLKRQVEEIEMRDEKPMQRLSHHKHCDVGEKDHSDSQQHHRPREPEAQVPEVKPSAKWEEAQQTRRQKNVCYMFSQQRHMNVNLAPMIPAAD